MTYSQKLKDPRWQKKRLEVFNRDEWKCTKCGCDETELHVHHEKYESHDPWETDINHLITVCKICHNHIEELKSEKKELLGLFLTPSKEYVVYVNNEYTYCAARIKGGVDLILQNETVIKINNILNNG